MAKIYEEVVVIKVSKLVKDGAGTAQVITEETAQALEAVVQEMVGDTVIVEVIKE